MLISYSRVLEKLSACQENFDVSRRFTVSTTAPNYVGTKPLCTKSYLTQAVSKILNNLHSLSPHGHICYKWDHLHSTIYAYVLRSCTKTCSSVLLWIEIFYYSSWFIVIDWCMISLIMIYERSKHVENAVF